jgi:hypothetical protein
VQGGGKGERSLFCTPLKDSPLQDIGTISSRSLGFYRLSGRNKPRGWQPAHNEKEKTPEHIEISELIVPSSFPGTLTPMPSLPSKEDLDTRDGAGHHSIPANQ